MKRFLMPLAVGYSILSAIATYYMVVYVKEAYTVVQTYEDRLTRLERLWGIK